MSLSRARRLLHEDCRPTKAEGSRPRSSRAHPPPHPRPALARLAGRRQGGSGSGTLVREEVEGEEWKGGAAGRECQTRRSRQAEWRLPCRAPCHACRREGDGDALLSNPSHAADVMDWATLPAGTALDRAGRRCRPAPWTPEAGPGDSGGMEERGVRLGLGRESEGMAGPGKNVDKPKKILIFF